MYGTAGAEAKKFIASISVPQSHQFSNRMAALLAEATAGKLTTMGDVLRRRSELIRTPAASAEPAATAEPDAADEPDATSEPSLPAAARHWMTPV